ncbi:YSNK protein, partial [Polypterus senegalus]
MPNKAGLDPTMKTDGEHVTSSLDAVTEILPTLVTPVKDAQAFVLSAFYDDRQNQNRIRIIGIAKRDHYGNQGGKLYCHVQCEDGVHVEPISAEVHNDHFSFPYGATTFVCTNPCSSAALSNVTVSTSSDGTSPGVTLIIQNTKDSRPPEPQQEFTVCTSTMFNKFSNVLQLLQSLEMYRLLGAGKVVIYKTSCSDQVQEVLDYYVKEGFVQMFDWTANLYLTVSKSWSFALDKADLHYQGQIVALNDCLYRHMYSSRHLVFIDQDEIIVPYKHDNWRDLIDYLGKMTPGANIFRFSNRVFPTDTYGKDPNAIQWNDVPGVNIMQYVNRETELESYDPKKMILDPRIVYKTSVHLPLDHFGSEKDVDEQDALMFHFKEHKVISEPWKDLRLSHYEAQLRLNVNKVLSQTLRRSYPLVVTPVDGADVFIISAFCDDRKLYQLSHDVIHIIGIVKRDQFENQHTALHCHIECESVVLHRHVHVQLHDDHHDFPYGTADFLCQNPCGSAAFIRVAVSTSDVSSSSDVYLNVHNSKVTQSTQPQRNFTVCISAMAENNDNVLQLVQSIEMYRRLGAEKVFIYKTNCSAEVQKVLDYYTAEGFLVVFNWTVDSYLKSSEILNHGQDTALHDCLYRNMYASRYLVINDIGEIILPYRHDNWQDLLDSLQSQNSRHRIFMFSSRIFHRNDSPEISGVSEWQNIPGVNIFQYVYREKEVQKSESKKIILDPQSVPGVFIPHFLERTEEVKEVDEDDAVLFLCEDRTANSMVINDSRIAYFDYKLKEKVNTVLNGVI